jgi:hypothetical protein
MATRKNEPTVKKPAPPATPSAWNSLLSQAIRRAEMTGDNRLAGLKRAMVEKTAEKTLRKLGILTSTDMQREFPE